MWAIEVFVVAVILRQPALECLFPKAARDIHYARRMIPGLGGVGGGLSKYGK